MTRSEEDQRIQSNVSKPTTGLFTQQQPANNAIQSDDQAFPTPSWHHGGQPDNSGVLYRSPWNPYNLTGNDGAQVAGQLDNGSNDDASNKITSFPVDFDSNLTAQVYQQDVDGQSGPYPSTHVFQHGLHHHLNTTAETASTSATGQSTNAASSSTTTTNTPQSSSPTQTASTKKKASKTSHLNPSWDIKSCAPRGETDETLLLRMARVDPESFLREFINDLHDEYVWIIASHSEYNSNSKFRAKILSYHNIPPFNQEAFKSTWTHTLRRAADIFGPLPGFRWKHLVCPDPGHTWPNPLTWRDEGMPLPVTTINKAVRDREIKADPKYKRGYKRPRKGKAAVLGSSSGDAGVGWISSSSGVDSSLLNPVPDKNMIDIQQPQDDPLMYSVDANEHYYPGLHEQKTFDDNWMEDQQQWLDQNVNPQLRELSDTSQPFMQHDQCAPTTHISQVNTGASSQQLVTGQYYNYSGSSFELVQSETGMFYLPNVSHQHIPVQGQLTPAIPFHQVEHAELGEPVVDEPYWMDDQPDLNNSFDLDDLFCIGQMELDDGLMELDMKEGEGTEEG
jgi:hypothetical protein